MGGSLAAIIGLRYVSEIRKYINDNIKSQNCFLLSFRNTVYIIGSSYKVNLTCIFEMCQFRHLLKLNVCQVAAIYIYVCVCVCIHVYISVYNPMVEACLSWNNSYQFGGVSFEFFHGQISLLLYFLPFLLFPINNHPHLTLFLFYNCCSFLNLLLEESNVKYNYISFKYPFLPSLNS